jgi:hypothetical protein
LKMPYYLAFFVCHLLLNLGNFPNFESNYYLIPSFSE